MSPEPLPDIAGRFGAQAAAYRASMASMLHPVGRRVLDLLAGSPPRRPVSTIVEVGAGVGTLLPDIRAAFPGARVLGTDRSRGMLALAPAGTRSAAMDASALALGAHSTDLVLAVLVLFFLDDPLAGLREARRVLRPGGGFACATWGEPLHSPALDVWEACVSELSAPAAPDAEPWNLELLDTAAKVAELATAAGLVAVRTVEEPLVARMTAEEIIRMRTTVGRTKRRYDALDDESRTACEALARERMAELDPEDFVARATLVYAVADAP